MMTLKQWWESLKSRLRSFLGLNSLATIGDIVLLRDQMAQNHRELMGMLLKTENKPVASSLQQNFQTPNLSWDMVQFIELKNMLENPPKED